MNDGRLMLLDTAALYFRAFFGVPETVKAPDGTPVNAVRGLLDITARLVTNYRPADLIACWDDDWRPRWRVDLIPSYKAHRVAELVEGGPDVEIVPDALRLQVPVIVETLTALGIPIVGKSEYEADDIIGTLAAKASGPVDVVTGDRDLFQVIDDARDVRVIYTARGMRHLEVVDDSVLRTKYGVGAAQYADYAVLRGDTSDGLPGVAGIGEKTAASLLAEFGSLERIVTAAEDPSSGLSPRARENIITARDYLTRAPAVVTVVRDLDLPPVDAGLGVSEAGRAEIERLQDRWGLGGSVARVLAAIEPGAPM
jgi:5'-3' exonuclease